MNKMDHNKDKKPAWVPQNASQEFTTKVMAGIDGGHDGMPGNKDKGSRRPTFRRPKLTLDDYIKGVLEDNRTILARAITLIESNSPVHMEMGQQLLQRLMSYSGKSIRIGITGVPGAGKSTFIEALGSYLCDNGHKVAVLAVDPSSTVTKGSILGDKTRMENLGRKKNAFIRPSPSSGVLGGVARKSRETMLLCEAAGFDVILVETVGVGQSEVTVRSMVDFFLLVMITGAGDELQGMKKGIMELCDAILINKADGDNKLKAMTAKSDYNRILHYLQAATDGWTPQAYTCSSITKEGIPEIWEVIEDFKDKTTTSGVFDKRRSKQAVDWVYSMIVEDLQNRFMNHSGVKQMIPQIENDLVLGKLSPTAAAQQLLHCFDQKSEDNK